MNELRTAGEHVKHLAKSYKAVLELGAYLEGIADLEAHRAEAEKARDKAVALAIDASADLAIVQAELRDAREAVDAERAKQVQVSRDTATAAGAVIAQAEATAKELREDAEADAEEAASNRAADTKAHEAYMAELRTDEADARARVQALNAEFTALRARIG